MLVIALAASSLPRIGCAVPVYSSLTFFSLLLCRASNVSTGYGNIAPSTEGGKIFCILYAIFGIPLFGFLLAGIGDQLGTVFVKSILRVERIFRVRYNYHSVLFFCLGVIVPFRF